MRHISIDSVSQSDKLGRNIYASDGRVLLKHGTPLTIGLISRLKRMGVHSVYLKDETEEEVEPEESVSEETKREVLNHLSESFQFIQSGKEFNSKKISKTVTKVIDELMENRDILLQVDEIRTKDNALLVHSMHVMMMSVLIGIKLGLTNRELKDLALGSLIHDVGKIIQDNTDKRHHSWKGFDYIRQKRELSTVSAHVALQHHEHADGTGQPRGVSGDDIHQFGKIVAVTNYYDNLIAPMDDTLPLLPYEACEKILGFTNSVFNYDVVWQFLRAVAFYPTGSTVRLSNGSVGTVSGQNKGLPQRPIIRVFSDREKSRFDQVDVEEVDLTKHNTLFIKNVIQE